MKKINEEFLQNYLATYNFKQHGTTSSLMSCYKMFTTLEVLTIEDLKNSPIAYEKFLMRNLHILQDQISQSRESVLASVDYVINSLKTKIRCYLTQPVADYAGIVKDLFSNHNDTHILDVGAAFIPYSAFLEGEVFSEVSTMDYNFLLPDETMKSLNVNAIHSLFDKDTKVSQYDAVVGKQPCTAIEHMVRNCKYEDKPYFIQLCECGLPNRFNDIDNEYYSWKDLLPFIDPNVRFYRDYAFNVDASESQVKKIIDSHIPQQPSLKYTSVITPEDFAKERKIELNTPFFDTSINPIKPNKKPEDDENDFLKMEMFERG